MQNLAEGTGGSYIGGEDTMRKPLARMVQDMTTYYEATYVPSSQEPDGNFRPIGVKPLRTGINIRSSAGYFAMPADAGIGIRPFELPLLRVLAEPKLPTELAFRATVPRLGDLPNRDGNTLLIEAPLTDVEFRHDTNTDLYLAHLSIVAQIKDQAGKVLEHFGEDIPRRGAFEEIERAKSEAVTLQHHFVAVPGEYTLEAAILDRQQWKGRRSAGRLRDTKAVGRPIIERPRSCSPAGAIRRQERSPGTPGVWKRQGDAESFRPSFARRESGLRVLHHPSEFACFGNGYAWPSSTQERRTGEPDACAGRGLRSGCSSGNFSGQLPSGRSL